MLSLTLGVSQLVAAWQDWRGFSLMGSKRSWNWLSGLLLLGLSLASLLSQTLTPAALLWVLPAVVISIGLQLWAGSHLWPPPHPDERFAAGHPAHDSCQRLILPDGKHGLPAYLLQPPQKSDSLRIVCLIHGAGDTKQSFKWVLIPALLAEGLSVLTVDLPGHGEHRQALFSYPDCLSVVPTAISYARQTLGADWVGVYGISLGGALAAHTLQHTPACRADALVLHATPLKLQYSRYMFYRELWQTLRSPIMSVFKAATVTHLRQSWQSGGYRSAHRTDHWIATFDVAGAMAALPPQSTLLIYSPADSVAPLSMGAQLQNLAPHAKLHIVPNASHVAIVLHPPTMAAAAAWLKQQATPA